MSSCKVKCVGYSFEFIDNSGADQHSIIVPRVVTYDARKFVRQIMLMVAESDQSEKVVLSHPYRVDIHGHVFDGIEDVTVTLSDTPGEVLVIGAYKSIIQLGPNTVCGSGRIINPTLKVKVDDILTCHQGLI